MNNIETKIAIFKGKQIRKIIYKNEWWFSILDIISVLTNSPQSKTYWAKMKDRDKEMSQPFPFWEQLKLESSDSKKYATDCANTEGIFRLIQSIPSPKAEPFNLRKWISFYVTHISYSVIPASYSVIPAKAGIQ